MVQRKVAEALGPLGEINRDPEKLNVPKFATFLYGRLLKALK